MSKATAPIYGLTHLDLAVRDPERSLAFYETVFGMTVYQRKDDGILVTTPGGRDLIQFTRDAERAGMSGGLAHVGFCVRRKTEVDKIVRRAVAAGATILAHRDISTGRPYAKLRDLDGYEVEVYKIDPATARTG
jgi:catechol 2,3-dioxygenase-like lactoylglutathione lyase family enzyme